MKLFFFVNSCKLGKQNRRTVSQSFSQKVGNIIYSDVFGPSNVETSAGSKYFLLFKDDYSRYKTVYFLKHKSEVFDRFVEYERSYKKTNWKLYKNLAQQ